jgi:hypothetical protein
VTELVFINLRQQTIRLLRKQETQYEESVITSGPMTLQTLNGLTLPSEWILQEPRPGVRTTLNALFPSV